VVHGVAHNSNDNLPSSSDLQTIATAQICRCTARYVVEMLKRHYLSNMYAMLTAWVGWWRYSLLCHGKWPSVDTAEVWRCSRHLSKSLWLGAERSLRHDVVPVSVCRPVSYYADRSWRQPRLHHSVIRLSSRLALLSFVFIVLPGCPRTQSRWDVLQSMFSTDRRHLYSLFFVALLSRGLSLY